MIKKGSIWTVEKKYFTFGEGSHGLILESGEKLGPITLAYETYGKLDEDAENGILLLHALSGDSHVAGRYSADDKKPGWWDEMVGPGKAFDTDKYFIICSNVLGGCSGSTGPSSINQATGNPYSLDFPFITIGDMVSAQKKLVEHLGIKKLLGVAGGSMGGMQAVSWLVKYPGMIHSAIPIATSSKHSPQQIAFHEVGRQAIMSDPNWNEGKYYGQEIPAKGLALARMLGHITYMSDVSMEEKFGRQKNEKKLPAKFDAHFEVEKYLQYKGDSFVKRFDANSYLYITKAMDYYDASKGKPLEEALIGGDVKILAIAMKSDWLYPTHHSKEIVKACKRAGLDTSYCEIDSTYGHDAFLLETKELTHLIKHFLAKVERGRD
ncbi:MAG: homoserine O-acetyltransferase [Candidatus Saganbacteria bacterium]|nr:homoserine O-acetyltransferase [Candidatus Saganbacteria bacterium]